jgi:hypothetical protein
MSILSTPDQLYKCFLKTKFAQCASELHYLPVSQLRPPEKPQIMVKSRKRLVTCIKCVLQFYSCTGWADHLGGSGHLFTYHNSCHRPGTHFFGRCHALILPVTLPQASLQLPSTC